MLKFPIFKLINEFIGEYLLGFSKDQMNLQLTEKSMTFNNLILNPKKVNEKFNSLSLFCHLKSGMIKELKIELLSIMESKDLKISLKGLFIILGPNLSYLEPEEASPGKNLIKDLENMKKKAKDFKKGKFSLLKSLFLEKLLLKNSKKSSLKKDKTPVSEKDKLIFEIFRNIKISVDEFHLRYEDDQLAKPFSFGLVADEISILTSEKNNLEEFNKKSQFVYLNLESKAKLAGNKLGKSKGLVTKTLILKKTICYFNTKSELYIPSSLYESTKNSKQGIFEAINYFDLEFYMRMIIKEKEHKFLTKLFEVQGKLQIDLSVYSDEQIIDLEENHYLLDLCSESMTLNIQRETIEAMSHFLEFIYSYSLLEILTHFKPRIRPQLHSFEKSLNRSIIKEWFELAIWFNRLKAYRDAQKLELIENSLLLSTHLDSVTQRPKIMKSVNKLIDSPWHIAFHMSFMYLKLLICEEWQKVLEIQIEEPVIDLAINQTPHTLSMHMKTEALQIIALETQEFEPERYEVPFTIPTFEKNSTKKKIFDGKPDNLNKEQNSQASLIFLKKGFNITFITSGLELDSKTIDLKVNLKPIEVSLKHSGIMRLLNTMRDFLKIPYFTKKNPTSFLQKRIMYVTEALKKPVLYQPSSKLETLSGFEKVVLDDISKEKAEIEKNQILDESFKKYEFKETDKNDANGERVKKATILYEELMVLKAKAQKKQMKEKVLDFKTNLKRLGVFFLIDYQEIDIKVERNIKNSPIIFTIMAPGGKITGALNQPQSELNYLSLNGAKFEFNKDLDYLFDLLVKFI